VQTLGTIGLSVRKGFDWQSLDESTLAGVRRRWSRRSRTSAGTTAGLAENADDQVGNWLPAPSGSFNLTMRYYTPLAPVLNKTYKLPAVRKV
jgi:hypothetical protein